MSLQHGAIQERVRLFLLSALRGSTAERYQDAVSDFSSRRAIDLDLLTEEQIDFSLADEVVELWELGDGTMSGIGTASLLLAAVSKCYPRHSYKTAWRCLDVWRVRTPPVQAPAFPPELALACVSWLMLRRRASAACAVLLCYVGCMRVSGVLALLWSSVIFTDNTMVIGLVGVSEAKSRR
jgi:hypothetical protein